MSDEENYDNYMSEESYEFEFEEEEQEEQIEVDEEAEEQQEYMMENMYYNAKCLKSENSKAAIEALQKLLEAPPSEDNIEWIFKSYKQLIKISIQEHLYDRAIEVFKKLILIIPQVNQSYVEDSISRMLSNYSNGDPKFVEEMYKLILQYLDQKLPESHSTANNRRIWLKINIHILNILLEAKKWDKCSQLIESIKENLKTSSESTRNIYSLELIAAEIQVLSIKSDNELESGDGSLYLSGLNELYRRAMKITTAVTHPRIMGIIRECGAKVQFYRGNYESARLELYESFKNFDEAGSSHKKKILKYLALCSLLTENKFNPFESQETQTYAQLQEFESLIQLIEYYDNLNLVGFTNTLNRMSTSDDDEVKSLVHDDIFNHSLVKILYHLRVGILTNTLKSYKKIKLDYLALKLQIGKDDLERMILQCISLGKLYNFKVDFVDEFIESVEDGGNIIPNTLNGTDILDNVHCLHAINYLDRSKKSDEDIVEMESEMSIEYDNIDESERANPDEDDNTPTLDVFLFQRERVNSDEKRAELLQNYLELISSAVPKEFKNTLTQKEQVMQEQRNTDESSITIPGNSSQGISHQHFIEAGEDDEEESIDKIDMLRKWGKGIKCFQRAYSQAI